MSSAHTVPYRAPVMTVNGSRTCSQPFIPASEGRSSAGNDSLLEETRQPFPQELWQLFLQSSLTAMGGKCRPLCEGIALRRLITAGATRQCRPRLEEVSREVRQFGVAVPGGVEHVGLKA